MKICVALWAPVGISESFIAAHLERLPAKVVSVELSALSAQLVQGNSRMLLSSTLFAKGRREIARRLFGLTEERERQRALARLFRQERIDVVLAEYGVTGAGVVGACGEARIPLVVHFHGFDASVRSVVEQHAQGYAQVFREAAGIVAVSNAMRDALLRMGATEERLHYNPYGVDCERFGGAQPETAPPVFVAVGRFVEKKAPHLTLLAFDAVHREFPAARLRMIGEGPLLGPCIDMTKAMNLSDAVTFLGAQPHDVVNKEMRQARAFVQHSVEALDGNCEGTPVAVLEAGASGLPVVATRHAGISDVVIEGKTGLLVEERDVSAMARHMCRLVADPAYAGELGAAARIHIATNHTLERSLGRLWEILESASMGETLWRTPVPPKRTSN